MNGHILANFFNMRIFLPIVILAVLLKDVSYLGDRFILRGVTQGLALLGGLYWLLSHGMAINWKKYTFLICFVTALVFGILGANHLMWVGLQVLSLSGCLLLFVGYHELYLSDPNRNDGLIQITLFCGFIVLCISLLLIKLRPDLVYSVNPINQAVRFNGLFGEPAQMAITAGLIFGIAFFFSVKLWVKVPLLIVSSLCLYLTLTRTGWIAWALALGVVLFWRTNQKLLLTSVMGVVLFLSAFTLTSFELLPNTKAVETSLRIPSLAKLSGRVTIWERGWKFFLDRPLLGYGFTAGDTPFLTQTGLFDSSGHKRGGPTIQSEKRYTLHNGYIQALLDSGIMGTASYLLLLVTAIWNILKRAHKEMAPALYILVFIAIANMGESVMFTASSFASLFAWYFVIFGLSLGRESESTSNNTVDTPTLNPNLSAQHPIFIPKGAYDLLQQK